MQQLSIDEIGDSPHTANLIKTDLDLSMQFKKYCEFDFNESSYNS